MPVVNRLLEIRHVKSKFHDWIRGAGFGFVEDEEGVALGGAQQETTVLFYERVGGRLGSLYDGGRTDCDAVEVVTEFVFADSVVVGELNDEVSRLGTVPIGRMRLIRICVTN